MPNARIEKKLLIPVLEMMLRPAVRFCVRHALLVQEVTECCKALFVEAAKEEVLRSGRRVTDSRVSVITGLHRRDVARLSREAPRFDDAPGLMMKVVGRWQTDPRYTTKDRQPRVLGCDGPESEFQNLVRSVSKELNPATVLYELERVQAAARTPRGLTLLKQSYVPVGDVEGGFRILGDDLSDLIEAAEENILADEEVKNLHARTVYDKVRADAAPELRRWLMREGHALHQAARNFIARFDQDMNPQPGYRGGCVKVVLGAFSRVWKPQNGGSDES